MVAPPALSPIDPLLDDSPDALVGALARWVGDDGQAKPREARLPAAMFGDAFAVGGLTATAGWIGADALLTLSPALDDALRHGEIASPPTMRRSTSSPRKRGRRSYR